MRGLTRKQQQTLRQAVARTRPPVKWPTPEPVYPQPAGAYPTKPGLLAS